MQPTALARTIGGLLLAAAVGCQPAGPAEAPTRAAPEVAPAADMAPAHAPAGDTLHIVAEKVVQQLLQTLTYDQLRPLLRGYARHSVPAATEPSQGVADSVVTYSAGPNAVAFLKSGSPPGGAVLLRCLLTEWPGSLTRTIRLGMSKAELGRVLARPFTADVLMASEEEGCQKFYFVFHENKLQAVHFESDYID